MIKPIEKLTVWDLETELETRHDGRLQPDASPRNLGLILDKLTELIDAYNTLIETKLFR